MLISMVHIQDWTYLSELHFTNKGLDLRMPWYQEDNVKSNIQDWTYLSELHFTNKGLDLRMPWYQKDNVNFNDLHSEINLI